MGSSGKDAPVGAHKEETGGKRVLSLFVLHIIFLLFSLIGVCSKTAAGQEFLSFKFCLFYGMVIFGLFVYALVWQQMLKRLPLVTAYANKAVTVVWGIIWGYVFFGEKVTVNKLIGAVIVIAGVILVVASDADAENKADPDTDECAGNGGAI